MRTTLVLEPGAARLLRLESVRRGGRRAASVGKIVSELAVQHLRGDEPPGERRIRRREGLGYVEALPGERTTPPLKELLHDERP
ncbi:MAG: hypothetical protein RLZZ15_3372 [Verrucomicrobiota bacterium]|jgi:hypothetical protein